MVVCQPGSCETAKSKLTTEWTLSTSGVASAARIRYATSNRCQWRDEPVQPSASRPYMNCFTRLVARSRKVARSGIIPTYQNNIETVKYVPTANTSHNSGLRKFGHIAIWFGRGASQYASQMRPRCMPGKMPAHMTAKIVMASAKRLIPVRHFCRNRNRMAEISVPA